MPRAKARKNIVKPEVEDDAEAFVFDLCNEPGAQYSMALVADRGLHPHEVLLATRRGVGVAVGGSSHRFSTVD